MLGCIAAMLIAFCGFVRLEKQKLGAQAATAAKASGALDRPGRAPTA